MNLPEPEPSTQNNRPRITAESMPLHLPGRLQTSPPRPAVQDALIQLFSHQTLVEPIRVPAVVEPLLVLVLAGAATVEERVLGGQWQAVEVQAGDFFLTHSGEPYDMRWQTRGRDTFNVMHLYLGLPLIERATHELLGKQASPVTFRDVSGARDQRLNGLLDQLHQELTQEQPPSSLLVQGLAQALAVHLVRHYRDPANEPRRDNALQAYKLRRVIDAMHQRLAAPFSLTGLAQIAELSDYHFSRLFKRATGLSPSRYFIRLRMDRARQLLLESERSIIDIGLEVGYSSASHFSQVFHREVGVTPSAYRVG